MKVKKKIVSLGLALTVIFSSLSMAFAANDWPTFRANNGITNALTTRSEDDSELLWKSELWKGTWKSTAPIIVGENIYVSGGKNNQVMKMDKDGNVIKTQSLAKSIGYFSYLVYGDGKVFVTLNDGSVQAFNSDTLESLWVSEVIGKSVQGITPLTYHNGYLYSGVTTGSIDNVESGYFYGINVNDNAILENGIKKLSWQDSTTGHYWAPGTVVNNAIIYGGDNGTLSSHALTSDTIIDTINVDGQIRSGVTYDNGYAYFTTKNATLYKVAINNDGTFGTVASIKVVANGEMTSTPAIYNGRIYVNGVDKGNGYKGFLSVINSADMSVIYTNTVASNVQSSPLVSTAYATKENNQQVYVYFTINNRPGAMYCLVDNQVATTGTIETVYTPQTTNQNYCTSSAIADKGGTLYYTNDSGTLFAIGNKNKPQPPEQPQPPVDPVPPVETPDTAIKDQTNRVEISGDLGTGKKVSVTQLQDTSDTIKILTEELNIKVKKLALLDISLLDGNDVSVQPNGTVTVKIKLPDGFSNIASIYRKEKDGTFSRLLSTVKDGYISFTTSHFSQYAIVEEGDIVSDQETNANQDNDKINKKEEGSTLLPGTNDSTNLYSMAAMTAISTLVIVLVIYKKRKDIKG